VKAEALILTLCAGLVACGGGESRDDAGWTVKQAESIDSVRGMPVRVHRCRGRGDVDANRHQVLACVAAARRPGERFDSVAVLYVLRPTGPCCEDYELAKVRFIGGPGIP
jgi:hypothetical protein